ncbi:group II intron reverse transcriptase/maturase [Chitinophaga sp. HK235]|uniref:group II intron reverse transcriptase/maturase n=1 Tax=Chitinophaga sp. HK235 TaxID=2952571 RepID=UPI001BA821E9|nr:group II intron reverse transcriptase/maturase [Chitinophaga sp. HK235]
MELLERILDNRNVRRAYERVMANKGSGGVDGIGIEGFKSHLQKVWPSVKARIEEGNYQPSAVRRVDIPKPSGGTRTLGIPTLLDRLIQQAIAQQLTIIYDETFSENSYGFRAKRNAHQALLKVRDYVNAGYSHVVDIDMAKFFDRVNHSYLMNLLGQRIKDRRVLRLIHSYLKAGVMMDGIATVNREGTPQGGPLSPILSNVLLDKLDKELEMRGHRFVRYADDVCVFLRSKRSAARVLDSVSMYIEKELKLEVNRSKSTVTRPWKGKTLGYSFYHKKGEKGLTIARSSIARYKSKVREITSRSKPYAMYKRYELLRQLNRGWSNYFKLNEAKSLFKELDQWVQRRIRQCHWKQWRLPRTKVAMLIKLGTPNWQAYQWGNTRKGSWRISGSPILQRALNKSLLKREGYLPLAELSTLPTVLF